jgi:hypothetical protein
MVRLCAQGDILIERVEDAAISGQIVQHSGEGLVVVAEGEATGHRHRLVGSATLFRDDALAREVPAGLYVGHLRVCSPTARLEHEEHASIVLEKGTYRVHRQRQLEPTDVGFREQHSTLED